jgi:RNA polymerase sigma-70 factor (ECF subfamily)
MMIQPNDDAHAVEMLYHAYQRPLAAYLARMIDDREAAEDLCQDTFFKALRGWRQHDPAANPVAWLYRIATNTAYDYLRRRRRARLAPLVAAKELAGASQLERQIEACEPVHSVLAQLPPQYRAPLLLVHAGHSTSEIAEKLGCTPDAVKMRLLRARARFRQLYQGQWA